MVEKGVKETVPKEIVSLLKKTEFVTVATSSLKGRPNAAPKLFLEVDGNDVILVDYVVYRIYRDLVKNPRAVISIVDKSSLMGYQLFGRVKLIKKKSKEYKPLLKKLEKKLMDLSVDRVIEGVRTGVHSEDYEMSMSEDVVFFKVKIKEISFIQPSGKMERDKLKKGKAKKKTLASLTSIPTETVPLLLPSPEKIKKQMKKKK